MFKNVLKIFSTIILCTMISLMSIPRPVIAAPITITAAYPEFDSSNIEAFNRVGEAVLSGNSIVLTPSQQNVSGAAWWDQKVSLENHRSFSAYFTFDISELTFSGADGLVFAVQTQSNGSGGAASGMGYDGISPSIGIEYDIYYNSSCNDINGNHIGIDLNGSIESVQQISVDSIGSLENGTVYHSWIDYDGNNSSLEIRLAASSTRPNDPLISRSINLESIIDQDVYVGFTGATGSDSAKHRINSFYFNNDFISGGITPDSNDYLTGANTVQLSASPVEIYAKSSQSSAITATVENVTGVIMPGQTIYFTTNLGSLSDSSAVTDINGIATVFLSGDSEGTATIRGTAEGGAFGDTNVDILKRSVALGVGGVVQPVNRLVILTPWMILILGLFAGSVLLIKRRKG